ncbi:MAG: hypothetical protein IT288_06535 [Bdellovibrionales bacterium]|nr:hypothetical protein [Bdellovibrionales bacterium]
MKSQRSWDWPGPLFLVSLLAILFGAFGTERVNAAPSPPPPSWEEDVKPSKIESEEPLQFIALGKPAVRLCSSTKEYIEALEFLRKYGTAGMRDEVARQLADYVSRGCDGAARRFRETYALLAKMGVSHVRSLEMGMDFASQTDEVQKNFFEILKQSYLTEFLNYDFELALKIAYEFSRDLPANHVRARNDFVALVRFCLDPKEISIPLNICGLMALELVRLSPHFPDGVFKPFQELYAMLRDGETFGLSLRDSLEVVMRVLKYGPRAPANFRQGYEYAVSGKGLNYPPHEGLKFALKMARRSATGTPLPLVMSQRSEEKQNLSGSQ